ncbi:MAG TPA: ABC transporter ATP-binding protein, partial [Gammaproteobacteria bacterium]|nr:ABC transporter ATP-binding protein [Gammaproteobacteria bacterium]
MTRDTLKSALLLEVEDLSTYLGQGDTAVRAVDGLDFSIYRGETFVLLGESGCGKSMTALSLMRLLPPSGRIIAGRVRLDGCDLLKLPEAAMRAIRGGRIAMIFQEPQSSLNPVLTIGTQIGEALACHKGLKGAAQRARVLELLDAVGIPDRTRRYHEYPHQLSGGMKQRVMIAMALAGEPDLLIADEPTTALDVTIQAQVLELLRQLQQELGMAILLITHDLGVVAQMADRVGVMYAGHIVEQRDRAPFFKAPAHPYSRKLFDSLPERGKRGQLLSVIRGTVPPLTHAFPACRFESRCDSAWETCRRVAPGWTLLSSAQGVRCHLHDPRYKDTRPLSTRDPSAPTLKTWAEAAIDGQSLLAVQGLKVHFPIRKGILQRVVGQVRA